MACARDIADTLTITESKTGKENILMVNKSVYKVLKSYLDTVNPDDEDRLFKSRKGGRPLSVSSVNGHVKRWTGSINLKGNYGSHSLRKTFAYIQRMKYRVTFKVLIKRFNHSSPSITMRYLEIQDEEINGILINEI